LKIRFNLFLVSGFIVTLAVLFSTLIFLSQMRTEALQQAKVGQELAIRTFWQLLLSKGSDFSIIDGKMVAGSYVINGNFELPDKIKEIFGGTATIFMGDTRVTTNVLKEDGTRAVGTRLTGPAYDAIFRENRPYRGEAPILGIPYFTAYDPIRDASGRIIGVLYVGIKKGEFLIGYARLKTRIIAGTSLLEILLIVLAWGLLRERVRGETRIREMADRIRLITDSVPVNIAYVDNELRYQFVNRGYEEWFALPREKIVGKFVEEMRSPEEFDRIRLHLEAALAGERVTFVTEMEKRDGSNAFLLCSYVPHQVEDQVIGFFVLISDITASRQLEASLQSQLAFLQTLIDTIPSPVFYKDRAGRYTGCNLAFSTYLGRNREELVGKTVYDLAAKELADRYSEMDEDLFTNPGVQVYDASVIYADGSRHEVTFNKATFNSQDGQVEGLVGVIIDLTERKKAEDILAEREEFLSNILDSIQDGISILDEELRLIRVNPVIEKRFSNRMPIVGRKCHEAYHGQVEPCETCPTLQTLRSGKPSFKIFPTVENGTEVWLELHTFPLFDSKKSRIKGVIEYTCDVTERKRTEDALIAAEEKFRSLVEHSLVGAYIIQDGNFVYVNPKMAEIFGYTREELTSGMSHLDLTAMQDRPLAAENVRRRNAGEVQSVQYEFQGLRKDGTKNHIEVYGSSIEYDGKPAIIGTLLDVTARSFAQEALRESEERFHQLFVQNGDAIILIRLDNFRIIDANPAAQELFRYDHSELVSLLPSALIGQKGFAALIDAIPKSDPTVVFQFDRAEGIQNDGSRVMIAIRCKILRLREEYIIHCSIRNITEKVQLEEDVRNAQAKLIHANKMTSIGMLASSVAHEINNPNNCISVNAAMLADVWRDAEPMLKTIREEQGEFMLRGIPFSKMQEFAPRLLDGIREGSRRITAIVQNMRDYVKEDKSGCHGSIDVNQLLHNAIAILWHHIHIHTDNFTTDLGEGLPPARGNGQQVEQVLINLITNALQALPDKKSGVHVTTGMENGESIIITVRDEGKGMDEATLAHLTEPFFTTRTDDGGTGLGLYISASIIKEHGGTLEFQSEPGTGTIAICRLPLA
jgi:PAS domain S-box-containing protein